MIIKYYDNGWNLIDNATNVHYFKEAWSDIMQRFMERIDTPVNNETALERQIQYEAYNKHRECSEDVDCRISPVDEEGTSAYISSVFYNDKMGDRRALASNKVVFILNDSGKTIERI